MRHDVRLISIRYYLIPMNILLVVLKMETKLVDKGEVHSCYFN